jgi:hypothetical protein
MMKHDDNAISPVIAGLSIGIALIIIFTILGQNPPQNRMYGHSGATPFSWILVQEQIENIKVQTPEAVVKKGTEPEITKDVSLTLIATTTEGTRPSDPPDPSLVAIDNNEITFSLYHGKKGSIDTVAVTLENNSPNDIAVFVLGIHGFIKNEISETGAIMEIETVYRPVISDPYDVAGATITSPSWILAGDSLTAYIRFEDNLKTQRYSANACYSYDLSDKMRNSNYCMLLPPIP